MVGLEVMVVVVAPLVFVVRCVVVAARVLAARPTTRGERAAYSRREEWQRERERGCGVTANDGAEADVLT